MELGKGRIPKVSISGGARAETYLQMPDQAPSESMVTLCSIGEFEYNTEPIKDLKAWKMRKSSVEIREIKGAAWK